MDSRIIDRLQLVGPHGANKMMTFELSRLCRRALSDYRMPKVDKLGAGAFALPFDPRVALVALRYHRTASRVLWDLYRSEERALEPLYDDVRAAACADERPWAWSGATISIRPRNLNAFPAGVRQVVGTVKNALIDGALDRGVQLGVSAGAPDLLLAVRQHDDVITVSVDLAGASLHERGYRREAGDAPLRENLAAVMLMLARYDARTDVVVDPMAGSGTLAIEAALMARAAPLRAEPLACEVWPIFDGIEVPKEALFADAVPRVHAIEIEPAIADVAAANAQRAGVLGDMTIECRDFRSGAPPRLEEGQTGLIITNPPYGKRLGDGQLDELYQGLARFAGATPGYRTAVIAADPRFERFFGGRFRVKKPLPNASVRSSFYLFD